MQCEQIYSIGRNETDTNDLVLTLTNWFWCCFVLSGKRIPFAKLDMRAIVNTHLKQQNQLIFFCLCCWQLSQIGKAKLNRRQFCRREQQQQNNCGSSVFSLPNEHVIDAGVWTHNQLAAVIAHTPYLELINIQVMIKYGLCYSIFKCHKYV